MKRIVVAGVLGGTVVFLWGGISWGVLPFQTGKFLDIPDETAVAELLNTKLTTAGVYHYPAYPPDNASEAALTAWMERFERGPVIPLLVYRPAGTGSPTAAYVRALLIDVVAGILVASLLAAAAGSLAGYGRRVAFVAGIAVLAVLVSHVADWSWGLLPASYSLVMAADILIGWTLAGLVMAWRIRPEAVRP